MGMTEWLDEVCPNCGADVARQANVCRACGSCEQTGWSEQARYDRLDLPGCAFEDEPLIDERLAEVRSGFGGWTWCLVGLMIAAVIGRGLYPNRSADHEALLSRGVAAPP
jgi:hypothetical protein